GRNVRLPGEDLHAGATVLGPGIRLGPAELGVAVTAGRGELEVGRRPRVTVVATGDELVAPGAQLAPGQIHDSNAITLAALARPALLALQGAPYASGPLRTARLTEAVPRSPERDEAVRVRLAGGADGSLTATPTGPQGSHVLTSMLGADGLALVEAGEVELAA